MAYEFRLPDLGEGVAEAEVAQWLVEVGQSVREDDPMVEVETDKATMEIPCPVDGTIAALHAAEGELVQLGELLVTIETGAEPQQPLLEATPSARHAANELGLDLAAVTGSGPGGSITEPDVRAVAGDTADRRPGRREPLRGVRRRIAENLTRSHQQVPKVTVVEECDFSALADARGERSYVPYVVNAVCEAFEEFPDFNATIEGDEIVYLAERHIGFAAQGPKGLIVPVIRDAQDRSLDELDAEVRRLGEAVRDGTIAPDDLHGGTFTVTLAGKLGGLFATPLVNPGEAAILGVHRIAERPVVRGGEIVIRQVGLVSCSFDHRITDGTRATMFVLRVIDALERP